MSAVILSTTAVFIRHLTEAYHLPALVLAFWRAGFAAVSLVAVLACLKPSLLRVATRDLGFLAVYGLVLGGFNATWTLAVALTNASLATVLVNGSAALTAVLGWWLLRERLGWAKAAAVAVSLLGCAIVSGVADPRAWHANAWGILTGLASALFYAAYSLLGRRASQRGLSPWTTVVYTFAFSCASLFLLNLVRVLPGSGEVLFLKAQAGGWGWLFLLAAGPTVVGFGLYNASMRHLPSSVANLVMTTEPVFTALLAFRFFGERLSGSQFAGSTLVMGGVLLLHFSEGWRVDSERTVRAVEE
jgi:drug/metabolite transporter (DMT)-like permease